MTLKTYLLGMVLSTVLCFASWILIVVYVDPTNIDLIGAALFYLSLFFSLIGLFSLSGFYIRKRIFKNEAEFIQTGIAFRQGILLALIFMGNLALQNLRMLTWPNAILLILGIGLMEAYFMSKK